jgi:hypothetical protein
VKELAPIPMSEDLLEIFQKRSYKAPLNVLLNVLHFYVHLLEVIRRHGQQHTKINSKNVAGLINQACNVGNNITLVTGHVAESFPV